MEQHITGHKVDCAEHQQGHKDCRHDAGQTKAHQTDRFTHQADRFTHQTDRFTHQTDRFKVDSKGMVVSVEEHQSREQGAQPSLQTQNQIMHTDTGEQGA